MPFLLSLLAGFVGPAVLKSIATRVVVALGFAAITYTGVYVTMNSIVSHVNSNLGQLGSSVLALISLAHIPQAFNVVLSAYTGALALRGMTAAGAVTKVGISSASGAVFSPGTF